MFVRCKVVSRSTYMYYYMYRVGITLHIKPVFDITLPTHSFFVFKFSNNVARSADRTPQKPNYQSINAYDFEPLV